MLSKHAPGCVSKHCPSCFQTRAMGTISLKISLWFLGWRHDFSTWSLSQFDTASIKLEVHGEITDGRVQVVRRGSKNNRSPASGQDVTKADLFHSDKVFLMPTCAISTITIVQDAPEIITRLHLVSWRQWSFQKAGGNSVWQHKRRPDPKKSGNAILKLAGHKLLKTEH